MFRRIFAQLLGVATTQAVVDPHVAAVNPTQLLQGLQKRRKRGLASWIVRDEPKKYADAAYSVDLLRARSQRPGGP